MWGNAHDEYAGGNPNKQKQKQKQKTISPKALRQRGVSKHKRPQRPKREFESAQANNISSTDDHSNEAAAAAAAPPPPPQPPAVASSLSNFKYRGRGKSKEKESKKPNPWAHAHDEYAQPKKKGKKNKSAKSKRPVRIRFETDDTNNTNNTNNDYDGDHNNDNNHPEEKSNRPLNTNRVKVNRRPKKKSNYVSAANIHAQQFGRSGYRAKPLPPDPAQNRRTNLQKMAHGQANFENMIKQAATMEGLDKSDVRVQRMIQRLGDQMSEVSGFNRFLQNRDEELAKMVAKQDKRKKQMDKLHRKINNYDSKKKLRHQAHPSTGSDPQHSLHSIHDRKGSVKDMAAQFERRARNQGRRIRNKGKGGHAHAHAHRNALKLPNTKSHRRRVSSQFSVQAISAVLSAKSNASSIHTHSPFATADVAADTTSFPNTSNFAHNNLTVNNLGIMMDDNASDTNTLVISNQRGRTASHGSRASFSRNSRASAVPSVIMMKGPQNSDNTINTINTINTLIISTPRDDISHAGSNAGSNANDPLAMLLSILKREPQERTEEEVDVLVSFFENYQIMTEDVDTWSGQATFRSFIQQTRYRYVAQTKHVFREGDDGDVFYFVLRGSVAVLVDDPSTVHTSSKRNLNTSAPKQEIHTVEEHHVFGEIAMFNQGKRSATCMAKADTYLAFWDRATYDEFIRPMKELKSKAQKILRDKQGNMLSEDQLIEKAAMFLDDAMHGRQLKMHRNGPWPRRIHKLINHKYFNYCLVMVSMLWLALIFIEPPSYRDSIIDDKSVYFYRIMPLIAFEWFVFLIFAGECLLRIYSFGSRWFFTVDLHVMRVVLLVVFFCDLIITCIYSGNSFRFSRVIRPIFPILFIRDLRRQYYIVLACVPYIIELIILWLIIAAIFARIAYHIFYHCEGHLADGHTRISVYMKDAFAQGTAPYNHKMNEYCQQALDPANNMKRCDQFFDDFVWNSFDTFFKSLIALFALLTTENFPEVWWPTWLSNEGKPYWTFFLVYALIAVFFLLNLFSAAVYDAYQHIISKLDVVDEKRETQALKVAWICLDTGDTGAIGPTKFENLMYRLKPEYTEFEIGVIFKLLDPDNNHLIDAEDFSIMMINVLYLSISRKTHSKEDELKLYLQKLGGACPYGYEILRAFTSQSWRYCMLIIQSIDICALLSYHMYPEQMNVVDFICIICILFALVIDVIFKHMAKWATYFKSSRNRLYFGLTVIQTVGTFIGIVDDREWLSALRFFGILRMLIVAVFALEKVKYLRTSLTRTLTQTVIFMIPVFLRIVVHISVVLLYIYTIIGIELFVDPDPDQWGISRCHPPQQILSNPYALFCDAQMTVITLTQILTTNNWHIIMYKAIEVTDNWFNALYFITFFFFGPILVVSLLLAMFFNMFFGISVQSENELSAFFHETDADVQSLKEHMELQEFKKQLQNEEFAEELRGIQLPTEVGISELPNGAKILTIRRPKKKNHNNDSLHKPLLENNETLVEPEPSDINSNSNSNSDAKITETNEGVTATATATAICNDEVETELVHIPLHSVARQIWENIPGQDWIDKDTNNLYKQTFNGKDATNYLLSAGFAPDGEEAVDYLALIMDEIGAFMRVDAGHEQEFENDQDAHYQWIIIPDDDMFEDDDDELNENDQVALEDIMIGFRHSYGGYHRLLKQYRQAGIDPTQEAARNIAAKHAVQATPLSEIGSTPATNNNNNNDLNASSPDGAAASASDLVKKVAEHARTKSHKLLEDVSMKLKKQDSKDKKDNNNNTTSPMSDDTMAESDDDGTVINYENMSNNNNNKKDEFTLGTINTAVLALDKIDSTTSEQHGLPQTKKVYATSTTNLKGKKHTHTHKQGSLELQNVKSPFTPTNAMRKAQSNGLNESEFKRAKTIPVNNENEDTIAPLGRFPAPPGLQKSKSAKGGMVKPGGLNRSASSKNILLRHLDHRNKTFQ